MSQGNDPRSALAAVERTEHRLSDRMHWPLWRHLAAGLLQAMFVIAWALPTPSMALTVVLAAGVMGAIAASDRRRNGMFVTGMASRAALPAIGLAIVATLGGMAAVNWASGGVNVWTPAVLPIAAAVVLVVTLASIWWERLYQAELRARAAR